MNTWISTLLDWLEGHQALVASLASVSIVTFIATLIAVPMIVTRLPPDYFMHGPHRVKAAITHPLLAILLIAGKNLLGAILILAGLAMLVLPGQGLLTLLIGVLLMNFPGKYRLELWLVSRPPIFRAINWLRQRRGVPPISLPEENTGEQ